MDIWRPDNTRYLIMPRNKQIRTNRFSPPPSNSGSEGQIVFGHHQGQDRLYKRFGKKWKYVNLTDGDWRVENDLRVNGNIVTRNSRKIDPTKLGVMYHKIFDDDATASLGSSSSSYANTLSGKDMYENLPAGTYIFILSADLDVSVSKDIAALKIRWHNANTSLTSAADVTGGCRLDSGSGTVAGEDSNYMTDVAIVTLPTNKDIHMQYKRTSGTGTDTWSDIQLIAILVGGA